MTRAVAALLAALLTVVGAPPALATPEPEPVAPPDFVALRDVAPSILQDMRYFTAHNFTGGPVDGYLAPECILTRDAAEGLKRAQQQLIPQGYSVKVYDCYRPQRAVNEFAAWSRAAGGQPMKAEFYPRVDKADLFGDGYIAERSGHSRGSAVDVTLVGLPAMQEPGYVPGEPLIDCTAPEPVRFPDDSIDMGTGFDCFDPLAHTLDPRVQGAQLANRLLLCSALQAVGFVNYENEWWHFTYQPERYPDTYFDFPVQDFARHA
ncbi:MAG: M15 family metallopeptidase [Mycobacterium sp.]